MFGGDAPSPLSRDFPYLPPSHLDSWAQNLADLHPHSADFLPSYRSSSSSHAQGFFVDGSLRRPPGTTGYNVDDSSSLDNFPPLLSPAPPAGSYGIRRPFISQHPPDGGLLNADAWRSLTHSRANMLHPTHELAEYFPGCPQPLRRLAPPAPPTDAFRSFPPLDSFTPSNSLSVGVTSSRLPADMPHLTHEPAKYFQGCPQPLHRLAPPAPSTDPLLDFFMPSNSLSVGVTPSPQRQSFQGGGLPAGMPHLTHEPPKYFQGCPQPLHRLAPPTPPTDAFRSLPPLDSFTPSNSLSVGATLSPQRQYSMRGRPPNFNCNRQTNGPYSVAAPLAPHFYSHAAEIKLPSLHGAWDSISTPSASSPIASASVALSIPCPSTIIEPPPEVMVVATNSGHREVVRHVFPVISDAAIDNIIHQACEGPRAFIIQSGDRRQLKTSMARSRSNDLSQIVNRFFYEDSASTINFNFKRVDVIHSTKRTKHLEQLIKHNQTRASKLLDRLRFMNDEKKGECRNPVIEEIFKFLSSKERLTKLGLMEEVERLGTIPGFIIRYGLVLTLHGLKKLSCGFWDPDKESQLTHTDYKLYMRKHIDQVVERMESNPDSAKRLWILFLKVQGSHPKYITLSENVELGDELKQSKLSGKRRRNSWS